MEDLGEASFLLGIDIRIATASRRSIRIGQSAYVTALLERHGMSDCKPCEHADGQGLHRHRRQAVGMQQAQLSTAQQCKASADVVREYQAVIGGLMFAMICTRPDIAYAVNSLAQFASNPTVPAHARQLKRVLRYLRGTVDRRITYTGS